MVGAMSRFVLSNYSEQVHLCVIIAGVVSLLPNVGVRLKPSHIKRLVSHYDI